MTWRDNLNILQNWISKPRVGIVSDMDGTLSHIVDKPDDAAVTPKNRELLAQLHEQLDLVALLSGRGVKDLAERVGLPQLTYVGNHGMDHWEDGKVIVAPEIAKFRPNLEEAITALEAHLIDGMWIEDKQTTLSVHYRNTANPSDVAQAFESTADKVAKDNNLEAFAGRMIFEIRPAVKINKGVAFEHLITTHNLDAAMYIGDDTTDVDAFIIAKHLRETDQCYSLAIGVDSDDVPASVVENSDFMVSGVSGVEEFLSWLLSASMASST